MLKYLLLIVSIVIIGNAVPCENIEFENERGGVLGEYCYYEENNKTIIQDIIFYGEPCVVIVHGEEWIFRQKKKTKISKKLDEFDIEKYTNSYFDNEKNINLYPDDLYPSQIKDAYLKLVKKIKILKKKNQLVDDYSFYNLVYENGVHDKTVQKINDLAYYYARKKPKSNLLIQVYKDILAIYPNRTVAYYNLGDAYWALGDKKKAKEAYTTYTEQMCDAGKQKRIPKVVMDRISSK